MMIQTSKYAMLLMLLMLLGCDGATTAPGNNTSETPLSIELRPDSPWTYLSLPWPEAYGERSFAVPAAQNWVNSGLYLSKGQTALIRASGQWSMDGLEELDANGKTGGKVFRGCELGTLVARIGLFYEDIDISCIGNDGVFVAPRDGILYLGAILSTDLGETYEDRKNAQGELNVTVSSEEGVITPIITASAAADFPYEQLQSGWVEVIGEHNILTLPVSIAQRDAVHLASALNHLDQMYLSHAELRSRRPYHGQPIRWMGDTEALPGWMLAGNPIRLNPAIIQGDESIRITYAAQPGNDTWGYIHELGHNFNFAGGEWFYTTFGGLEAWPNIFSLYTAEQLNLAIHNQLADCAATKTLYLTDVKSPFNDDPWIAMCFFKELREIYGWELYHNFYQKFNINPGFGWAFLRERFGEAVNDDVNQIFDDWALPRN